MRLILSAVAIGLALVAWLTGSGRSAMCGPS